MATTDRPLDRFVAATGLNLRSPTYVQLVYGLVVVWGLGDVVSTYFAMAATGGAAMEANPWLRLLIGVDPLLLVVVKGAVVLYAGVVLLECRDVIERVPGWQAWFAAVIAGGTLVICNNLAVGAVALL